MATRAEMLAKSKSNDLKEAIGCASQKISMLKVDVKEQMHERYVKHIPKKIDIENVLATTAELAKDNEDLLNRLNTQTKNDIEDLNNDLGILKESLVESTTILDALEKLCYIHSKFVDVSSQSKLSKHYLVAKNINEMLKYLNKDLKDLDFLEIYKSLTAAVTSRQVKYYSNALDQWSKCIVWKSNTNNKTKMTHSSLKVSGDKMSIQNLIKTLELYEVSDKEITTFSENLKNNFLVPLINYDCSLNLTNSGQPEVTITSCSVTPTMHYTNFLHNLTIVFTFLNEYLGVKMHEVLFLKKVGQIVADDFLTMLIDCLTNAIPLTKKQPKAGADMVERIISFQSLLSSIGFIAEDNKSLELYFGNPEQLSLNKKIENYIAAARLIAQKELHECELIEENVEKVNIKMEDLKIANEPGLRDVFSQDLNICPDIFKFPKCFISKSLKELIQLLDDILTESLQSDKKTSAKLFDVARSIISMYWEVIEMYHSKFLHDIPKYSALMYNNLMYLAHHVLICVHVKRSKATSELSDIPESLCFNDLVKVLRENAVEVLSEQVQIQQKILISKIKESGLSALSEYEKLPENIEKSLNNCLFQLKHLREQWAGTLPTKIYSQAMGSLCTVIVDEVTNRIVVTSDIRADVATALVSLLSQLQADMPNLFDDPNEVFAHVKSWLKLKELVLLLGASLLEISERWADGMGPLASEFTAEQVRQMIKALFQISDRRAAVLSKIK